MIDPTILATVRLLACFRDAGPGRPGMARPCAEHALRVLLGRIEGIRAEAIDADRKLVRLAVDWIRHHLPAGDLLVEPVRWVCHELAPWLDKLADGESILLAEDPRPAPDLPLVCLLMSWGNLDRIERSACERVLMGYPMANDRAAVICALREIELSAPLCYRQREPLAGVVRKLRAALDEVAP